MKNWNKISLSELSENPAFRSRVAKTQQPDAERLNNLDKHAYQTFIGTKSAQSFQSY